jgi:hypothetical protein
MRFFKQHLISLAMMTALASPLVITGCAARVETGYRVYDPYYNDYHVWDSNEAAYYQRWETDTHRHHQDFRKRNKKEQQEYWTWRHNQDHTRP